MSPLPAPPAPPAPTVFVVDDDPDIRSLLECFLQRAGYLVEVFLNAQNFLDRPCFDGVGCIVLDIHMPGMSGLDLQKSLAKTGKHMPIIFITGQGDIRTSVAAMKRGAVDFLTKPFKRAELLTAVDAALDKHRLWRQEEEASSAARGRIATLTPREQEVMLRVVAGRLNKQIAGELGVSEITVKVHRGRVMEKMGVTSVAELVRLAERGHLSAEGGIEAPKR